MQSKIVARCRVLVVGSGITGLALAWELVQRGVEDIVILDKEYRLGAHASGRNSGVLHAGIYYTPDSLKARFCIEGNRLIKQYCRERGLTVNETGKVIVARNESELPDLGKLKERAEAAGTVVEMISALELRGIEPYAATFEQALYSPETAVINPKELLGALAADLDKSGRVQRITGQFLGLNPDGTAQTTQGSIGFEHFVNAAGAFADKVAKAFGVGSEYRILPFKGTYKQLVGGRDFLVRGNIYPVPDLRNPFLGVHFTRGADGVVTIGPTAIPAFGRENYHLLDGLRPETAGILWRDIRLLLSNAGFRSAAAVEPKRYLSRVVYREAKVLVPDLALKDIKPSTKVGIRAQLVNWKTKELVMDFVAEKDGNSLHVLNAISPAMTSSMSMAKHLADKLLP